MKEVVRVAALTGYFETMATLGIDPTNLLREQGLDRDMLANSEYLIPARATMRLLERSANVAGCLTLGLRMVEGRSLANLGATALLIAHQATLRKTLEALQQFRSRINSTLTLHFDEGLKETILREDFQLSSPESSRQASELALGVLARLCRASLGDAWAPHMVCFAHHAPPRMELPIYSRVFGCPAQFDCAFNGIVIASADLDKPNVRADEHLALHAHHLLVAAMNPESRTTRQDVEQLLKVLLPTGRATIQICARSLGVTVRTLQRMLDAEAVSFSQLLNNARTQLAVQYLSNPRMRVTDVADLLGYNSIGAFSRWFTQCFGKSPRDWRKHPVHK